MKNTYEKYRGMNKHGTLWNIWGNKSSSMWIEHNIEGEEMGTTE